VSVFPAGTENLVAQQFGLRKSADALAKTIVETHPRHVDVGSALGRRFLLMVGFGFDGDIVTRHHNGRLSSTGLIRPTSRLAYVGPVLRSSFSYKFPPITVKIENDGVPETLTGSTVFLFNAPRYALGLPFVPTAQDDDGWLDLLVFRNPGAIRALYYLWRVFWGTHLEMPSVFHRRVKSATVTTESAAPIPIQIDGDPGGFLVRGHGPAPVPEIRAGANVKSEPDPDPAPAVDPISASVWRIEIIPDAVLVYTGRRRPLRFQEGALATDDPAR
jgi:diacylglycerol kinase (ATP)